MVAKQTFRSFALIAGALLAAPVWGPVWAPIGAPVWAQTASQTPDIIFDGAAVDLDDLKWERRPLIVFGDSPNDPRFLQQMDFLTERLADLETRDVIILTDTDPDSDSALRRKLRPRGFMIALIGKDGVVFLRKPLPWDVRELTRAIDKMPLRQREIQERRGDS